MYQVANAYPGIYQGIVSSCTMPDATTTAMDVYDCALLQRYWTAASSLGVAWSPAQQAAAAGEQSTKICDSWNYTYPFYAVLQPELEPLSESLGGVVGFQNCGVTAAQAFNPETNPRGVRCDLWDDLVNVLGLDPRTGYANQPLGNVGVEYGSEHSNASRSLQPNSSISTRRSAPTTSTTNGSRHAPAPAASVCVTRTAPGWLTRPQA